MKETAAAVQPGTAALFVLVRKVTSDKVLERLKGRSRSARASFARGGLAAESGMIGSRGSAGCGSFAIASAGRGTAWGAAGDATSAFIRPRHSVSSAGITA
ncbi:DUF1269 domain-containing protein [Bradyrhizobium sp. 41S5]|uniref:DUF1269 domain-containing protein n=1 Tax=Bradyrhizobium sp. 41S5 TaxID=1404443 RepID=UPI0035303C98